MTEHSPASPPPARLRVFFALWPGAATAAALHARARALQAECGGRAMRRDTIHLTLAFLGDVAVPRLAALGAVGQSVRGERFVLELDRVGNWRGNRILWSGCAQPPAALPALAEALAAGLRAADFELEARAFNPHVTLVRNALRPPQGIEMAPLRWPVASFVLVASERNAGGAHYRVLGRWQLGDGGGGEAGEGAVAEPAR